MHKVLLSVIVSSALASAASASSLLYEGFTGPTGALLGQTNPGTGTNWLRAGVSTGPTAINVVSGSLTPPLPLQPASGNAVAVNGIGDNSGSTERLALLSSVATGTVYYSLTLQVTALTGSNTTTGGFFFALNNTGNSSQATNPTVAGARLQARINPTDNTKYDIGVFGVQGATAASPIWQTGLSVGDTVFVVGSYTFVSGASNDTDSLWLNPSTASFGAQPAPAPTTTDTNSGTDLTSVASILLRQSPAPFVTVDEIRVGTTWEDVTSVPEPATIAILGLGVVFARRRRCA